MVQIDLFYDLLCPWCFIGKRRLEQALRRRSDVDARISWRAFQIDRDMPADGMDPRDWFRRRFGAEDAAERKLANIHAAGESVGIPFAFQRIRRAHHSLPLHRLVYWAGSLGCADRLVEALFAAYFVEGRALVRPGAVLDIVEGCGLDRGSAEHAVRSRLGEAEYVRDRKAAVAAGISVVPCFVFNGRYRISGALPPRFFDPLLDLARNHAGQERGAAD